MTSAVLHLGDNRIVLGADADLNRLRIEIDQAIRMGGGWVDVPGAPRFGRCTSRRANTSGSALAVGRGCSTDGGACITGTTATQYRFILRTRARRSPHAERRVGVRIFWRVARPLPGGVLVGEAISRRSDGLCDGLRMPLLPGGGGVSAPVAV